ncbi:MAG: 3,5-cyclic-AMP phosphodiesterase, partial [Actinomycetota bacterium]|nr:3,5-cyclic-AMP phosphodiesterase [Actinomycetota bacterium]
MGPDEVVVTFRTDADQVVTTAVGASEVTTTGRFHSARVTGLEPETPYRLQVDGAVPSLLLPAEVTTMARPSGRLVATFATANDVHFGEIECGRIGGDEEVGPIFSVEPGEMSYPEVMNHGAIDEMIALRPDTVVVKGDLTDRGTEQEYDAFCAAYGRLGERMHHIRGNHDAMITTSIAAHGPFSIELDGVTLAVLDTVVPGVDRGALDSRQLEWLDELAAET